MEVVLILLMLKCSSDLPPRMLCCFEIGWHVRRLWGMLVIQVVSLVNDCSNIPARMFCHRCAMLLSTLFAHTSELG